MGVSGFKYLLARWEFPASRPLQHAARCSVDFTCSNTSRGALAGSRVYAAKVVHRASWVLTSGCRSVPRSHQPGHVADIQREIISLLCSFSWDIKGQGILLTESGEPCVGCVCVSALFYTRKFGWRERAGRLGP